MGIHILHDTSSYSTDSAALYCSNSDWAFGPVFSSDDEHDAVERAQAFLRWIETDHCKWTTYEQLPSLGGRRGRDVRGLTDASLERAYHDWLAQEAAQYQREAAAEAAKARELWGEEEA